MGCICPCPTLPCPLLSQRLPCGVVLRHRLLARPLAGGRAPPHVQGAGGSAAGGQAAGAAGCGRAGAVKALLVYGRTACRMYSFASCTRVDSFPNALDVYCFYPFYCEHACKWHCDHQSGQQGRRQQRQRQWRQQAATVSEAEHARDRICTQQASNAAFRLFSSAAAAAAACMLGSFPCGAWRTARIGRPPLACIMTVRCPSA